MSDTAEERPSKRQKIAEESPLVALATSKLGVFQHILAFVGDAPTFLILGYACRALNKVMDAKNDNIWELSYANTPPLEDMDHIESEGQNRTIKKEWLNLVKDYRFQFLNDDRLSTAFEKVMVGHAVQRMREEKNRDDNIFITEFQALEEVYEIPSAYLGEMLTVPQAKGQSARFQHLWLFPLVSEALKDIGSSKQIVFRQDFVRAFAAILEANVVDLLERAYKLCLETHQLHSREQYPLFDDSHGRMLLFALGASPHSPFGGRGDRSDGFGYYSEGFHFGYGDSFHGKLDFPRPMEHNVVRRLAYRAGIVKLSSSGFDFVWKLILVMSSQLVNVMCQHEDGPRKYPDEHFLLNNNPRSAQIIYPFYWMACPWDLEKAAKCLGLRITKCYDDGSCGKAMLEEKMFNLEHYKKVWQSREATLHFALESDKSDVDPESDLSDSDSSWDSYNEDEKKEPLPSFSLYESDFSMESGDEWTDDDMEVAESEDDKKEKANEKANNPASDDEDRREETNYAASNDDKEVEGIDLTDD